MTAERVVVIGSNSFSGSDFIDLLLERGGYDVHGVSRSPEKSALFLPYKRRAGAPFTFHRLDLNRDLPALCALLDELRPAYVANFAAQSEVEPSWEHPDIGTGQFLKLGLQDLAFGVFEHLTFGSSQDQIEDAGNFTANLRFDSAVLLAIKTPGGF